MAKSKYKFHKIIIHPNRWLIWAVAYAIVVAIALTGYIKVSQLNLDASLTADNEFKSWHSYSDKRLGFNLRYPADWAIEAGNSLISFIPTNSEDAGVNVAVVSPSAEKSLRKNLKIKNETNTVVDGVAATKIENDLGQGSETVVMARHYDRLYVISGSSNLVDQLLLTFNFLNSK